MIAAFTGHRPQKIGGFNIPNPIYNYVKSELRKNLLELKPTKCISGMALGTDQIGAELCIELNIPFIAAIPFIGQEKKWPKKSQDKYFQLLECAEEKIIVCPGGYSPQKMQDRNEWMADRVHVILAVWDGSDGGTANCIRYAQSIDKRIILINPKEYNA